MKVEIFTLCDASTVSGGKLNLLGSFDRLAAPSFPFEISEFSAVAKVRFENAERGERSIDIRVVRLPSGNVVVGNRITARVAPRKGQMHLLIHQAQFYNTRFDAPGKYEVQLLIDGRQQSCIPLFIAAVPWTTPLYRFLRREHAESLVNEGNLRLNPPVFLHDEVKLGSAVGDASEGRQQIIATDVTSEDDDVPKPLREMLTSAQPKDILGIGLKLVITEAVIDSKCDHGLIYSMTRRMAAENVAGVNGDTWVVIENPALFCLAISRALPSDLHFRGLHPCTYAPSEVDYKDRKAKINPVFLKNQRYSHQEEVRAVWLSRSHSRRSEPLALSSAEIAKFCRIVD